MEDKDLKAKLNEIKAKIKANSKDSHFADALISDLLSTKGLIDHEPIELNVGKRVDSFDGDTFEIVLTDRGCMYHEYGGYSIFVPSDKNYGLYSVLSDFVISKDNYYTMDEQDKDNYKLLLSASAYCLSVPKICFSDSTFMFDIASMVVKYIRSLYDEGVLNAELQEETIEEDKEFEEGVKAVEGLKDMLKELNEHKGD